MSIPGTLSVGTGVSRFYFTGNATISNITASVGTSPATQSAIFDVNKNGTTIFTTQGNRPTITAGSNFDLTATPDVTSFVSGDYITVDVDQVGTGTAGADAVITIYWS
jgi:hypothetical protein